MHVSKGLESRHGRLSQFATNVCPSPFLSRWTALFWHPPVCCREVVALVGYLGLESRGKVLVRDLVRKFSQIAYISICVLEKVLPFLTNSSCHPCELYVYMTWIQRDVALCHMPHCHLSVSCSHILVVICEKVLRYTIPVHIHGNMSCHCGSSYL